MSIQKISLLGLMVFVLTGCVKMHTTSTLGNDGQLNLAITYDFTPLQEAGSVGEDALEPPIWDDFCDSYIEEVQAFEINNNINPNYSVDCTMTDEVIALIEIQTQLVPDQDYSTQNGVMIIDFQNLISFKSNEGIEMKAIFGNDFNNLKTESDLEEMRSAGFETSFTINLPGEILKSDIGQIGDRPNQLQVNMDDLMGIAGGKKAWIEVYLNNSQLIKRKKTPITYGVFSTFQSDQPLIINPLVDMQSEVHSSMVPDYNQPSPVNQRRDWSHYDISHPILKYADGPSTTYQYHRYQQDQQKELFNKRLQQSNH